MQTCKIIHYIYRVHMITFSNQPKTDSHEYPGAYHPPAYNWSKVMQQLKKASDKKLKPSLMINETSCCYSIEIEVPGYSKENFMVTFEGNKLNIYGLCPNTQSGEQSGYHLHEGCCDCFEHAVILPKYIDADFVRAEYRAGILRFNFPKSDKECIRTIDKIIVY